MKARLFRNTNYAALFSLFFILAFMRLTRRKYEAAYESALHHQQSGHSATQHGGNMSQSSPPINQTLISSRHAIAHNFGGHESMALKAGDRKTSPNETTRSIESPQQQRHSPSMLSVPPNTTGAPHYVPPTFPSSPSFLHPAAAAFYSPYHHQASGGGASNTGSGHLPAFGFPVAPYGLPPEFFGSSLAAAAAGHAAVAAAAAAAAAAESAAVASSGNDGQQSGSTAENKPRIWRTVDQLEQCDEVSDLVNFDRMSN